MFDIFVISSRGYFPFLQDIKERFPYVKVASNFVEAQKKSLTSMFYVVYEDIKILDTFNFNYEVNEFDKEYVHIFKNTDDSKYKICLIPKTKNITIKENDYWFFLNNKEIDLEVGYTGNYEKFIINNYNDYENALKSAKTEMFWGVWDNIEVIDNNIFSLVFPIENVYDRNENHVWLNSSKNENSFKNGLVLFSKFKPVTKKEIEYKTLLNRKEHNSVASQFVKYQVFNISTYDDYTNALQSSSTDMFWGVWDNLEILDQSVFDLQFEIDNLYDRNENHVWLTLCGNDKSYGNGLVLFSKTKLVSKKEIEYKTLLNRKEHKVVAARARYPKYFINTYDEYLKIKNECNSPLFWCIWNEITITDHNIFDLFFDPFNGAYDFDRHMNHVFKNKDIEEDKYNGLMLMSKHKQVPKREIDFRFIVDKKEHNKVVSKLKPYDIVFISYNEANAEVNYQLLVDKNLENTIHRVQGIKGIHNAHLQAAKLVSTPMFYVVDGDAVVKNNFNFSHLVPRYDRYIVHVWHSENPVNGLLYGYGGVKLLPTKQTLEMDLNSSDMTSSISTGFRIMTEVSNITAFNTDAFSTWRSAFRECVKLSSKIILGQIDEETENRLEIWCNSLTDAPYSEYALLGAQAGKEYGKNNAGNIPALNKINDFDWLIDQFNSISDINGKILEITSAQALATS